ncbi:MAG: type II secretion system GspH family protein [Gammaproteobacteria bacterium]|nr:type II secretion system GspH family protein [Gammaproteobacteria bacterium]
MKKLMFRMEQGFTLVELLIVVIILAILAAIVVPQFASSTDDAKLSALDSTLANMRGAIDLYYQQHGKYPSAAAATGATCPGGGAAGTGAINTVQSFVDQMTRYTNSAGQSCTTRDAIFKYGPYLKKDLLPNNPLTDVNTLVVSTAGALGMTGAAVGAGWKFDNVTGQFIADDAAYDDH